MSPAKQLIKHFRETDTDYPKKFAKFIEDTINKCNGSYDGETVFDIYILLYNVKTFGYEKAVVKPKGRHVVEIVGDVVQSMIGMAHPWYCVGYCLVATALVSTFTATTDKEREEVMKMADELGTDDPLAKQMLTYGVVSVTGVKKLDIYEVYEDGSVKESALGAVNGKSQSLLLDIFEDGENVYEGLVLKDSDFNSIVRKNIFE